MVLLAPRRTACSRDPIAALLGTVLMIILLSGPVACRPGSRPVYAPYPPNFAKVPTEQVVSSMWVLAAEVRRLEQLLEEPVDGSDPDLRENVRLSLERMTMAARRLETPGRDTPHHPVLGRHLERFLSRLQRARRAIDRTPPDYFQAAEVAGGCYLCHGSGPETARGSAPPRSVSPAS